MEEHPTGGHLDERIPATFDLIRAKGVRLVFGDLSDRDLDPLGQPPSVEPPLLPSFRINLDPTALVGICSDLLHHPLPADEGEAKRRFFRPTEGAEANGVSGKGADQAFAEGESASQSKNSRELYKEISEEMEYPLIEAIRDTLAQSLSLARQRGEGVGGVEFWASKEAVRHLREAMCSDEIIGEGMEQRRMRRLVGIEEGDFFEGSRYEGKAGVLEGLRLRVYGPEEPGDGRGPMCERGMRSFHLSIAETCATFLEEHYASTKDPAYPTDSLPAFLRPDKMPVPKIAQLSLPFPIVTLHATRRGAVEGMTTLSMGNIVFRELFSTPRWRVKGWAQGNYDLEDRVNESGGEGGHHAVVWMLPYRSFAEGKRVRFEKGDYSFPPGL
jgi:hypothetical protein